MTLRFGVIFCAVLFLAMGADATAGTITVDFDGLVHGEIVSGQYTSSHGLTISAVNPHHASFDLAAAFDTNWTGGTSDTDLLNPWDGGNLPSNTDLGKILIISENDKDDVITGILDDPDDEGRRPAGFLILDFTTPITSFGFDLVDVEIAERNLAWLGTFYMGGTELARVQFSDFDNAAAPFHVTGTVFGNNTANRISPLTAAAMSAPTTVPDFTMFDRVKIQMGGSGGIDTLTFTTVPLPSAVWAGLGLLAAMGLARRLRRNG